MKFFFDASFSKRLCYATRALEVGTSDLEIVYKPEKFPGRGVADEHWIGTLATERDWVVLTLDYEILRKPHERAAWDEAGLTGFFFDGTWGNLKIDECAWRFLRWWPIIKGTAGQHAAWVDIRCAEPSWATLSSPEVGTNVDEIALKAHQSQPAIAEEH